MVSSFTLSKIPQIIFGPETTEELPSIIKKFGHAVLIITGASSFKSSVKGKNLLNNLESEKLEIYRARIIKEPSPTDIDEIDLSYYNEQVAKMLKKFNIVRNKQETLFESFGMDDLPDKVKLDKVNHDF